MCARFCALSIRIIRIFKQIFCLDTKRSFKTDKGRLNNPPPAEHQSKVDASLPREQEFGTTLEEFGFHFDDKGVLRDGNGDGFVFNVSKNTFYNERRYEAMANAMIEEVYNKLQEDCGLEKIYIPEGKDIYNPVPRVHIFSG